MFNAGYRFGRIIGQRWQFYGTPTADVDRYQYGYDQNSNRIWKANTVTTGLDELYVYDPLNRLVTMQRGPKKRGPKKRGAKRKGDIPIS